MAGFDDVATPVPQSGGGFDAVATPYSSPKIPDMSGVQRMAQDNLAANDNKEFGAQPKPPQTPAERLNTAVGMPVNNLLNPDDKTPIAAPIRKQYTKMLQNGDAVNFGDAAQSILHAVAPIVAGGINRAMHPIDFAKEAGSDVVSAFKGGGALLAYPFLSKSAQEEYIEENQLTPYKNEDNPQATEIARRGIELEQATVGHAMGGLYAPLAIASPIISPIIQSSGGAPTKQGEIPTWQSLIPSAIGVGMDVLGGLGMMHGANELREATRPRGPWDNLPGKDVLAEHVGKVLDKPAEAVTSSDFDQTIAQGTNHKAPSGADFKAVETVSGGILNEKTLHIVFNETGIPPDQVFANAQHDQQIAKDVSEGKVPEAYEPLAEKRELPPEQLQVVRSDTEKGFNVVDKDGDYVSGGFRSADEARHYIEDKKTGDIGDEPPEWKNQQVTEKTAADEQSVIPGAERISDRELAERNMEGAKKPEVTQKPANEGLFDVAGRGQKDLLDLANERVPVPIRVAGEVGSVLGGNEVRPAENIPSGTPNKGGSEALSRPQLSKKTIPPAEIGKPTSLYTFLRNNGGLKDEGGNLAAMGEKSLIRKNGMAWDDATELAHQHGYFSERPSVPELQDRLLDTNGGRDHYRDQDTDRVLKAKENSSARRESDPAYIEDYADKLGLDTVRKPDETERQFITRLKNSIKEFYKSTEGSAEAGVYRKALGDVITAVEKFIGKLTGNLFQKIAEGYVRTFQPELMGNKALRADAYLAKYKVTAQEAENAYYRQMAADIKHFDRMTSDERMQWLYDHETGRWDDELDPEHAAQQAMYDKMHEDENNAGVGTTAYKDNYLPHQWENPDAVNKFFRSDAMIKKYGRDWFNKASEFRLVQEGVRAGFKLKTDNPARMLIARQLASRNLIATMDLLKDMESSGIATRATLFSLDKRMAKTQEDIANLEAKYKAASDKINDPKQLRWDFADPAVSKYMKTIEARLTVLKERLEGFNQEKSENKLSPEQMKELKENGFKVIGPDNKVWNLHQEVDPLWKNAMEMKGLWEQSGVIGDAYRTYTAGKAVWTDLKLALSLFHPIHVADIHLASGIAATAEHLIQGGKFSDLALKDTSLRMGIGENRGVKAWNTAPEARTPQQKADVQRMVEGGFKPTMSARDEIHFKENFNKAINGVGLNNLRLISAALQLPGKVFEPLFSKWIPHLRSEMYFRLTDNVLARDPTLADDAGRRGEAYREISKAIDRTYGQMNQDTRFWNKVVRDAFDASFISGGWKLAQIYNARGLLQPANILYKFAKTGEFSKEDITYQMLHAYAYTATIMAQGAAINYMLGNPIGKTVQEAKDIKDYVWSIVEDCLFPKTGERNPDGTPIRLNQPAFTKEAFMFARDINTKGLLAGTGSFLYNSTIFPGIGNSLLNHDFYGRQVISDPTDLHQWMNAGWEAITPIAISSFERAEQKGGEVSKWAGLAGFPIAGAYINQTPFEQRVIEKYDERNAPKGDVYTAKLKLDLRSAIANKDTKTAEETKQRMKEEGMTEHEISNAEKIYTTPFSEYAWKQLSQEDQKHLIEGAPEEEKKKFKVKTSQ